MYDIMFDLETLDTEPSAAILTLGAVKFDPKTKHISDDKLLLRFDVDEQFAMGRTYSESTLTWWGQQSQEVQEAAFEGERTSVKDAADIFHKYCWNSFDCIWSQGSFDVNIMEHLYRQLGRSNPWNFWQVNDSRTFLRYIEGNLDRSKHHNALEDAIAQANAVQTALNAIGWKGQKVI